MTSARATFWPSLLAALALHGAALGWLLTRPPAPPRVQARRSPTTVKLVTRQQAPPAPPAPAPPPDVKPRARPAPAPAPARLARPLPTQPPAAPPPGPPPPPRRFAVAMSATAPGGGVAVPVTGGPTAARGDPGLPASTPVGDNTAFARAAAGTADVTEVERAPRLVRQPSSLELRALYPEAARRDGLEGDVRLELLVDERGAVAEVRLLERAGNGFDEVAPRAARLIVFRPAERAGRAVAVRIPWTLKFRLDG
ncbi:MAG: energy transducer TonB [Anaeromyxobacter sp.]|nr:energy transducer TonB [Anaeromyxobacter sp.]MBL0278681.1 energy transducer TonB [Anaeromyxobacter sp.]